MKKSLLAIILCLSTTTVALANNASNKHRIELDTIVAVVNDQPILKSTLNQRIIIIKRQLEARHVVPPADNILREQVLNQLIQENVQLQLAESRHIEISSTQVNREIQKIADEQHITLPELFKQAENDGLTRENYEQQLKNQLCIHALIQNMLASKITISQKDIDLYRHSQLAHATAGKEYQVAHILIALDTSPTAAQVHEAEIKSDGFIRKN
ncbi:MAG: SurA N-terminal domain-containing protein [Gammaproteobacteria bacterium]|nr:SurA N-terminal domain-containing protein [Gammaproteobacteria bacterium]